jgi:hypothetical protein
VALVALGYAFYQHRKAAAAISASDQNAIATAIGTASLPPIFIPAPVEVQGGAGGYTYDMSTITNGAY